MSLNKNINLLEKSEIASLDNISVESGRKKIEWAYREMPVLSSIIKRFERELPLKNKKLAVLSHVTTETANLAIALKAGGADCILIASNILTTQDDVASSLVCDYKIPVFGKKNETPDDYRRHLELALDFQPDIILDDGGDLLALLFEKYPERAKKIIGSTEETTSGVVRLKSMESEGVLSFPAFAVNDCKTKFLFDNRYGTGQSTLDGILRATNILLAGKTVVVVGFGWCGRGVANKARGMGAKVIVTEIDPVKALEASMEGFQVMKLSQAVKYGDLFITVTGNKHVIDKEHLINMKTGAIVCNSGAFDFEINIQELENISQENPKELRSGVREYILKENNKKIIVLAEGRIVNLSCAEGHPSCVMDLSYSNQCLSVEYLIKNRNKLENKVYILPEEIDRELSLLKLNSMNIEIDRLTQNMKDYLSSWKY